MTGIIRLTVQNLLRVRLAEVTPDGALVIVAGNNDQGKSSLLNSIAMALSGKDIPPEPIRQGAASGHVILETAELVVTRRFSRSGGSTLEVRDRDGAKVMSPQAKLDTLVSRVTFDPFEFTRQEPKKQLETVRRIAGLDFMALDTEFADLFEKRTVQNRAIKMQEGKLAGIPRDPAAPQEEVSVAELMEELSKAEQRNRANAKHLEALSELNDQVDTKAAQIERAMEGIKTAEEMLRQARQHLDLTKQDHSQSIIERDAMKLAAEQLVDADAEGVKTRIKDSESINAKVRSNLRWHEEHRAMVKLQQESQEMTERLEAIKDEKARTLEKAKFPVEGLGFSDSGVTFAGVPFEQAGTAVKIRVSVAIARSLNPKLPVMLIRDGSLLDENSLKLLQEECEKYGTQCWLECVGNRDDAAVILEEGEVVDRPAARKKKEKK